MKNHEPIAMSWQEAYPASSGLKCTLCGAVSLGWMGCKPKPIKGACNPAPHDATRQEPATTCTGTVLDELRAVLCGVRIVGTIHGNDVIYRDSVIDLIDRRRAAIQSAKEQAK